MTIDTTYLDSGADKIKLARPAILAMAQEINAIGSSGGAALVGFLPLGTGAVATDVQTILRESSVSIKRFGAVGDGVTDDTAAITAAINYVQSLPYFKKLTAPAGLYKITSPLPPITKNITIEGENPRTTQLMFSGIAPQLNIIGSGSRASDVVFRNIGLNGASMTAGYLCVVDFAQNVLFENVYFIDPFNGVSIRQAGNTQFISCLMDSVRGTVGVSAYGNNAARNGQNDQIDILAFSDTIIQSNYTPGGAVPTAELLVIDGRVHTVQISGLRLLSAKKGLVTKNTPALAANFVPRFITGNSLEMENHYAECADFQACVDLWIDNIFVAGSYTADGIKLSSAVGNWCIEKGTINSNSLSGLYINGATDVTIGAVTVYGNSLVSTGAKSGIYIIGSGTVDIRGGLCGKAIWLPAYTEKQKYGVELDGAFSGNITCDGVDMRGNNVGSMYDNSTSNTASVVKSCPGFNPRGPSLQSVGASPYTYTAGLSQESVNIYGGTGVVSTINGVAVANASPASYQLHPRQSVTITYSTVPTMAINKS